MSVVRSAAKRRTGERYVLRGATMRPVGARSVRGNGFLSLATLDVLSKGRIVAAFGPFTLGLLTSDVFGGYKTIDDSLPMRYAGVTMCLVFLVGLAVLPFAPETKGKPLPE